MGVGIVICNLVYLGPIISESMFLKFGSPMFMWYHLLIYLILIECCILLTNFTTDANTDMHQILVSLLWYWLIYGECVYVFTVSHFYIIWFSWSTAYAYMWNVSLWFILLEIILGKPPDTFSHFKDGTQGKL